MAEAIGLSPIKCRFESDSDYNAEVANREMVDLLLLESSNLESSSLSLGTMDGLSMVRHVVLKTTIRCNSRGFDTSALRKGIDSLEKPEL